MTSQQIIDELDKMNMTEIAIWGGLSVDGIVDEAGEGQGPLNFTVAETAAGFDNEDSASQIVIIGEVSTHVISINQGGDPRA